MDKRPCILVVEDNAINRELIVDLLEMVGYVVIWTENGETCLALAHSRQPDLILMDLSLPGVDGLTATRWLQDDPLTCAIPVIAVTAHALALDREQALAAGCVDYVTKPIQFRHFLDLVAHHVPPPNATVQPGEEGDAAPRGHPHDRN